MDPDQQAREEIGHTEFGRGSRGLLIGVFVAALLAVPVLDFVERSRGDGRAPGLLAELADIPRALVPGGGDGAGGLVEANRRAIGEIGDFEDFLERTNWIRARTVDTFRGVLYRWMRSGTERVVVAPDRDLFLAQDLRFVASSGGWEKASESIRAFGDDLQSRGIRLVVVPIPVKPTIEADRLAGAGSDGRIPLSPVWMPGFLASLRGADVEVFDPVPVLVAEKRETGRAFLRTDTHWEFKAMKAVARSLAGVVGPRGGDGEMDAVPVAVTTRGDLWRALEIGDQWAVLPPETQYPERVAPGEGAAGSGVVVLGDSFTNIYATPSMGWGRDAGLAEQLARFLGSPVVRVAFDGDGINAPRRELARRFRSGELDPASVRVVVWAFAVRDLVGTEWRKTAL